MMRYLPEDYKPLKNIQCIYIEKSELHRPKIQGLKKRASSLIPHLKDIYYIDDFYDFYDRNRHSLKRSDLFFVKNRGQFHKPCPGTKKHICCHYQVLDIANNCYYDCRYCILQAYFPISSNVIYTNTEKIEQELKAFNSHSFGARFGTGQFTDSLLMEPLYPQAEKLIKLFDKYPRHYLEFKTKSIFINHLLPHAGKNIILSWSLNTPQVIDNWEENTCTLERRLEAAQLASSRGFPPSFHFDPIICYPGWQEDYKNVIKQLFNAIDSRSILYMSLGCLRYSPKLKKILLERGIDCSFLFGPNIFGKDGKMRYFFGHRKKVYDFFLQTIYAHDPDVTVYFCMERPEMWQLCMEENMTAKKLGDRLYQCTHNFFSQKE